MNNTDLLLSLPNPTLPIYFCLKHYGPMSVDDICQKTKKSLPTVYRLIAILRKRGISDDHHGQYFIVDPKPQPVTDAPRSPVDLSFPVIFEHSYNV